MLDARHAGDSWPNKRDLWWEVLRKKRRREEELKDTEGRRRTDRWKKLISRLRYEGGGEGWIRQTTKTRWNETDWVTEWDRKRLKKRDAEEENCGKSSWRIGVVMRRVYQLFRCRLLIKHHQTLNLLTINTPLHYRAFSPPFFFLHLSLSSSFSFPLGLSVSLSLCVSLSSPFCLSFSLSNTPNAGQINYLMHLSLSARAQSNLLRSPFTDAFSHKKSGLTHEKENFLSRFFSTKKRLLFFPFLVPLSLISPELIKLQSMCCKRLICWFPMQT